MGWLNEVFPDNEQWQTFSNGVVSVTARLKDSIEIGKLHHLHQFFIDFLPSIHILDPRLKKLGEDKLGEWRVWFDNRLDNAIEAAEVEAKVEESGPAGSESTSRRSVLLHSRMIVIFN